MATQGAKVVRRCRHGLSFYVRLYGLDSSTIRNAADRGWPLDNPARLLETMLAAPGRKYKSLDKLRQAVNEAAVRAAKRKKKPVPAPEPLPPPSKGTEADESEDQEETESNPARFSMALAGGLMAELQRLRRETATAHENYKLETRPAEKMILQKIWHQNSTALRQMAKEAPRAEREAGNVLVRADVEAVWSRIIKEFRSGLEMFGRRISTDKLFADLNPVDVEQLCGRELVTTLALLETGKWMGTPQD